MIKGTAPFEPPQTDDHVARAFWLTAKVETGAKFGAIVMYDGTAVTAGLDQHIAVYPKELANEDYDAKDDQGGFWKLLRRMEVISDTQYNTLLGRVWKLMEAQNWYLAQDGVLRYAKDCQRTNKTKTLDMTAGDTVFGWDIRNTLTPQEGKAPKTGVGWEQSAAWARAFNDLFSHPAGFGAQVDFGKEHLVTRTKSRRINLGSKPGTKKGITLTNWNSLEDLLYMGLEVSTLREGVGGWSPELDLAAAVYQSHSVNAPAIANKAIAKTYLEKNGTLATFPERLIKNLGNNTYGRWDDDLATGRYQRTRTAALDSKLWPRSLFIGLNAIMSKDLPG